MAIRYGNHGASAQFRGAGAQGIGGHNTMLAGGWQGVSGKAGDISYLSTNELTIKLDNRICVQAVGGSVKLSFTLQNPKRIMKYADQTDAEGNPTEPQGIDWCNELTVAPGEIQTLDLLFTAMRIEFVDDATLYTYSR